jgi:RNA polymerase sigma-70 factor (ECF subfamily)
MTEDEEHILIEQCKKGDINAYTLLVKEYQNTIFNCAWRIVLNREDAADITQSAFLKLFERIETFDSNRKFFSWMYRIAINEALDHKRRRRTFDEFDEEKHSSDNRAPDASLEDEELKATIAACLRRLPDDARVVITLKHFSGLSYNEIGEILEIPERTVKSRLYSARQKMKNLLPVSIIQRA